MLSDIEVLEKATQASGASHTVTKCPGPEGQDRFQVVFLTLSELGQPVKRSLDGKVLQFEHCRTYLDIYATIAQYHGYTFPMGEPPLTAIEVMVYHHSRPGSNQPSHKLASDHDTKDTNVEIWEGITLGDNMSSFAEIPLISINSWKPVTLSLRHQRSGFKNMHTSSTRLSEP